MRTDLSGPIRIINYDKLQERAKRTKDPRHVFYKAMLSSGTYEKYLALVKSTTVQPQTTSYVVTGLMEICYCKDKRNWIA